MELQVYYQPMINLSSGKIGCFEALLRWHHPTKKNVSPIEFIPIAEDTGLIVPLGYWVLKEAIAQTKKWQKQFSHDYKNLIISVNLSARQVLEPCLLSKIEQLLQQFDFKPECLKLEVTESLLMENFDSALEVFLQLERLGVGLAIDDFGTGYSSLARIQTLPVRVIKIDRSFIKNIEQSESNLELVRGIVALGSKLGKKVIVEGVETESQLKIMQDLGADEGQGYYFTRPLNANLAQALLDKKPQWEFWQQDKNAKQRLLQMHRADLMT